jgi:hypothetical protein
MSITLAEAAAAPPPALPTYVNAAGVLENRTGSGLKLAGWTVLRTALIAPPFLLVGVPAKKAFGGAALASVLISSLTLLRIFNGGQALAGAKAAAHFRR